MPNAVFVFVARWESFLRYPPFGPPDRQLVSHIHLNIRREQRSRLFHPSFYSPVSLCPSASLLTARRSVSPDPVLSATISSIFAPPSLAVHERFPIASFLGCILAAIHDVVARCFARSRRSPSPPRRRRRRHKFATTRYIPGLS